MVAATDAWASAPVVSKETDSASYDTTAATRETGEPTYLHGYQNSRSVWIKFTAPTTDQYVFWSPANWSAVIDVFQGSTISGLTPVAGQHFSTPHTGYEAPGYNYSVSTGFDAVAGTTYSIRITGNAGIDKGAGTVYWLSGKLGWSGYKTPQTTFMKYLPSTGWRFTHSGSTNGQPEPVPGTEAGYEAAWNDAVVNGDYSVGWQRGSVSGGTQDWYDGASGTQVSFNTIDITETGYWNYSFDTWVLVWRNKSGSEVASWRGSPPGEENVPDTPFGAGQYDWKPGMETQRVSGGKVFTSPVAHAGVYSGGVDGDPSGVVRQESVILRPAGGKVLYDQDSSLYAGDLTWDGTYGDLVSGIELGHIHQAGTDITQDDVSNSNVDLQSGWTTLSDGVEYLNLIYRPSDDTTMPAYQGSQWEAMIEVNAQVGIAVQLPDYRTWTWMPGVTWWDGNARQPARVNGWWSESAQAVQTVALRGWWDGTYIQPLLGGS